MIISKEDYLLIVNKRVGGIYCITSPNGKKYIGQSLNLYNRLLRYRSMHCKRQIKLHASLNKYGVKSHLFEILFIYNDGIKIILDSLEYYYWLILKDQYKMLNLKEPRGSHGSHSEETKKKIALSKIGKKRGEAFSEKMRILRTGKHRPEMKGEKHHFFGKKFTKEHREKMSKAAKERDKNTRKGVKLSEKTKEKMSLAKLGKKRPKEVGLKIGLAQKGEKHHSFGKERSKSTKEKISNTLRKRNIVKS